MAYWCLLLLTVGTTPLHSVYLTEKAGQQHTDTRQMHTTASTAPLATPKLTEVLELMGTWPVTGGTP